MALASATLQVEKAMTAVSWLCAALASETPERDWKLLPASREAAAREPAAPYVADTSERISKAATSALHRQVPESAPSPAFRTANNKSSDEEDKNGKGPVSHGDAYGSIRPVPSRREPLLPLAVDPDAGDGAGDGRWARGPEDTGPAADRARHGHAHEQPQQRDARGGEHDEAATRATLRAPWRAGCGGRPRDAPSARP